MIIAVYAPHDPRDKRMLWDYLAHVINQWQGEVVIMGDFNEVRVKSDRFGTNFNVLGANIFNSFINSTGLEEVHLGGTEVEGGKKDMDVLAALRNIVIFIPWIWLKRAMIKWCKWRNWIQSCLTSSKGSILVNGCPTNEFQFYKGLKQGDPLSPFLFILVMESLHLSFQRIVNARMFKGHPSAAKLGCLVLKLYALESSLDVSVSSKNRRHELSAPSSNS
ncbi:RNA-directed DNA polymerase, eukaryota [Tanacetum coccineum]